MYRRCLIPFATMMLLWWLVAQLNHYLAPCGAYLFVGGLPVTFAALRLRLRHGLPATLLAGLAIDAVEPAPFFGTHLVLFAVAYVLLFHLRTRFPREETVIGVVTALFANLAFSSGSRSWPSMTTPRPASPGCASLPTFAGRSSLSPPPPPGFSPCNSGRSRSAGWISSPSTAVRFENPGEACSLA